MTKTKPQPPTLTVAEAAAELDYSPKYLYRLIEQGDIPSDAIKQRRRRCAIRLCPEKVAELKQQWGR